MDSGFTYERRLRHGGPIAKALRDCVRALIAEWEEAELSARDASTHADRTSMGSLCVALDMAVGTVMVALGTHVAWGADPVILLEGEITRNPHAIVAKHLQAAIQKVAGNNAKGATTAPGRRQRKTRPC